MAEVLGVVLAKQTGIPFTVVRPWNLYGPGQRLGDARVPMSLMRMALEEGSIRLESDGTPTRSPCFVWDGLLQLAACLDPAKVESGPVNIGNPQGELSILDLARRCAEQAGVGADSVQVGSLAPGMGLTRCVPSIDRLRARAGAAFARMTSLTDGLVALSEWVRWSIHDA